jgi:hypothetical protein
VSPVDNDRHATHGSNRGPGITNQTAVSSTSASAPQWQRNRKTNSFNQSEPAEIRVVPTRLQLDHRAKGFRREGLAGMMEGYGDTTAVRVSLQTMRT